MIHGHAVLEMMQGHTYTEAQLIAAIEERFGKEERFFTCSAQDLTAAELVAFLQARGKFMPADAAGATFTVDSTQVCHH